MKTKSFSYEAYSMCIQLITTTMQERKTNRSMSQSGCGDELELTKIPNPLQFAGLMFIGKIWTSAKVWIPGQSG